MTTFRTLEEVARKDGARGATERAAVAVVCALGGAVVSVALAWWWWG